MNKLQRMDVAHSRSFSRILFDCLLRTGPFTLQVIYINVM